MLNKLKMLWQDAAKEKYVFFDFNDVSLLLAEELIKQKKGVVMFLLYDRVNEFQRKEIESIGAHCFIQQHSDTSLINDRWLRKIILSNKTCLFFLSDNDLDNFQPLIRFFSTWKKGKFEKVKKNVELIIRVNFTSTNYDYESFIKKSSLKVKYTLFNEAELIASEVVRKFPPIDTLNVNTENATVNDTYEALIIGFDTSAEAILRKLIEATQFVGTQFKATVMLSDKGRDVDTMLNEYPEMRNHYDIDFLHYDIDSDDLTQWTQEHIDTLKQIVISAENDDEKFIAALNLETFLSDSNIDHIPIIIVCRDHEKAFLEQKENYSSMRLVGDYRNIFTESNLLKSNYLQQAKAVHHFYNQLKPSAQRVPWEQLSYIKKESNIAAAESLYAKLKLMGKTIAKVKKMSEVEFQLFLQENPERLLNLAKAEHLRWSATYFTRGWKTWQWSKVPKKWPHHDEKKQRHACLVDWDALKEVEKRFNIPFQLYDYNNVFIIRMLIDNNVLNS